jgi:serralysin
MENDIPKLCIDQTILKDEPIPYIAKPETMETLRSLQPESPELEIALVNPKKWTNGRTLKVSFLEGDPSVQEKVKNIAKEWEDHANIKLDFFDNPNGDIRIAFRLGQGSWSAVGRDAVARPINIPTMNFGWLTPTTDDAEYRRVVLHEFGHAIGCIHEHQNPDARIQWKKEKVYEYFMGPPNNWSREQVDHNIFERYSKTITNYSRYDDDSIMIYNLPAQFTVNNQPIGKYNTDLSTNDKIFIKMWYPF